jgi:hypothetical protein
VAHIWLGLSPACQICGSEDIENHFEERELPSSIFKVTYLPNRIIVLDGLEKTNGPYLQKLRRKISLKIEYNNHIERHLQTHLDKWSSAENKSTTDDIPDGLNRELFKDLRARPYYVYGKEVNSMLQCPAEAALADLGHKNAFDLLLKEAWNQEVAALGNSTLPTVTTQNCSRNNDDIL